MANTRKQVQKEDKVARVPFGGPRLRLQLSEEERKGFTKRKMVPRWFNDDQGRIERSLGAGYNFVKPEYARSLGQGSLHMDGKDSESGARVSQIVSRGDPVIRAYLMETSEKFYKEDQATKESVNALVDDALALGGKRGSELEGEYRPT